MQHSWSMDKGKTIQKNKSILQPASLVSLVLYNGLISFQMRKRKKIKQSVIAITTPKKWSLRCTDHKPECLQYIYIHGNIVYRLSHILINHKYFPIKCTQK